MLAVTFATSRSAGIPSLGSGADTGAATRGEWFAEEYARRYESRIWGDYLQRFGL